LIATCRRRCVGRVARDKQLKAAQKEAADLKKQLEKVKSALGGQQMKIGE
jgi:hypothetical protein